MQRGSEGLDSYLATDAPAVATPSFVMSRHTIAISLLEPGGFRPCLHPSFRMSRLTQPALDETGAIRTLRRQPCPPGTHGFLRLATRPGPGLTSLADTL